MLATGPQFLRHLASILATSLLVSAIAKSASAAPSQSTPLFDAFKEICADTDAKPERVRAVLQAAGGKSRNTSVSTDSAGAPFPITGETWDVIVEDHHMMVTTGTGYPSQKFTNGNSRDFDDCTIASFENEDSSVKAAQLWVGVPPQSVSPPRSGKYSPDMTIYSYGFQLLGSNHVVLNSQAELRSAESKGRYWGLVLLHTPHSATIQFTHELSVSDIQQQPVR